MFHKAMALLFLSGFLLLGSGAPVSAEAGTLVAYFSWSGNTGALAKEIQTRTGGDIFEIKTEKVYPSEYRACLDEATKELKSGARPKLRSSVPNMADYDVVFVGYPIWWGTVPMAVLTFLEQHDLAGKRIIPFCTHGGSGISRSVTDMSNSAPKANFGTAFSVSGTEAASSAEGVAAWLKTLGITG